MAEDTSQIETSLEIPVSKPFDGSWNEEAIEYAITERFHPYRIRKHPVLREKPTGDTPEDDLLRLWRKKAWAELWVRNAVCWEE